MASVPTAADLGLGTSISTSPDRTPIEGPSSELAFAANKIAAQQGGGLSKNVSQIALKLSDEIADAQAKIKAREDSINRTREFNSYYKEISGEFQAMSQGDLTSQSVLNKFNLNLQTRTEEILNEHTGSPASREKFAIRLENQRAKFAASARDAVDTAQQAMVDQEFGDNISKIVARVATGELDLSGALVEVDGVAEEYAKVAGDGAVFDKTEAAQELVILNTLQRFVDLGETKKAEALINNNPEVIQTLEPVQVGKLVRSIEVQKQEQARLIAEKKLHQDNILHGAGVSNPRELSPQLRMLYYTGKMGAPPTDNRTNEMKNADALTLAGQKYGTDSPQYKNLASLIFKQQAASKTTIEKQFERLNELKQSGAGDSQEAKVLQSQINEKDPIFIERKEKEADFPGAQENIIQLQTETKFLLDKIDEALMLATGEDTIGEALKEAMDKDFGNLSTGNFGAVVAFVYGSSDAANLEAALMPIRSNTILNVMDEMRAQSSSGATGLGAMSEPERIMLRDAEGALDPRVPEQLVATLLRMRTELPLTLARQQEKFLNGFADVLGITPETPDGNSTETPKAPRGDGKPKVSQSGAPVISLNRYEKPDG